MLAYSISVVERDVPLGGVEAATSLARLRQRQGQCAAAHELLAPIYGWFIEGFDSADLREAKALLEERG